jgi:septal ring factor EnvC (AmiA/AmiB activator)
MCMLINRFFLVHISRLFWVSVLVSGGLHVSTNLQLYQQVSKLKDSLAAERDNIAKELEDAQQLLSSKHQEAGAHEQAVAQLQHELSAAKAELASLQQLASEDKAALKALQASHGTHATDCVPRSRTTLVLNQCPRQCYCRLCTEAILQHITSLHFVPCSMNHSRSLWNIVSLYR